MQLHIRLLEFARYDIQQDSIMINELIDLKLNDRHCHLRIEQLPEERRINIMRQGTCYLPIGVSECQRLCTEILSEDGYHLVTLGIGGRRLLCAKPLPHGTNYVAIEIVFEALSQTESRIRLSLRDANDLSSTIPTVLPHLVRHLKTDIEKRAERLLPPATVLQPLMQVCLS